MFAILFIASIMVAAAIARPVSTSNLGKDPRTWTPKIEPKQNATETVDKCNACTIIVSFIENQQQICTVVPDKYKAICAQLVQEFPADVICKDFCEKTYIIEI